MKQDRFFDGLSQRFQQTIYQNQDPRGAIRLHIAQDDLITHLPHATGRALDIGAGLGQMSSWLAAQQWQVTLSEPSLEMLEQAQQNLSTHPQLEHITFASHSIQTLPNTTQPFDLVVCHAVLEWLAEPQATLQTLLNHLKPDGYLSLMFFNRTSSELRHLVAGDLQAVLGNKIASNGKRGLAPISPLLPTEVLAWLPDLGVELVSWSGVRCFYDYVYPQTRKTLPLPELLLLERRYSQQEPWRSIARYQHFILKKSSVRLTTHS